MSGMIPGYGITDEGSRYIGIDTTAIDGNDRSAIPMEAAAVTTGPTDLKAGGSLSMAGVSGKTNFLTSLKIDYLGATAASVIVGQVSGGSLISGGARTVCIPIPSGATLAPQPIIIQYDPPLRALATNATITFTVPSFGSGAGVANCTMTGYRM